MPEGPSIVILKEEAQHFLGHTVLAAISDGKIDFDSDRLIGQKLIFLKTFGKHFLMGFEDFTIRIHLLMFGKYYIDGRKEATPRIGFRFSNGELNFYTCSVKLIEDDLNSAYDWRADVMNDRWDARSAKKKVKATKGRICDVLLDQDIFGGVGNIIKNEVLYRTKIHPNSIARAIPDVKMRELIATARDYSFEFLNRKKKDELKKSWQAHTKKKCRRCDLPMKKEYFGRLKRRSFFCDSCQKLYS